MLLQCSQGHLVCYVVDYVIFFWGTASLSAHVLGDAAPLGGGVTSTAFHPQTDGQSERMIQTLENSLRPYVERHPQTWSQYLALAEFAANNAINVATGYNPFYLNSGDHPLVPSVLMHGGGVSSKNEAVQTMVDWMKTALEEAQANLTVAQSRAKSQVDRSRRDETFEVGNEVVLSTRNIHVNQHLPSNIRRHWIGPY